MTLKEAAEGSNLTIDGLSKIERNINGASMAALERLSRTYRCEIGDLLPNSATTRNAPEMEPMVTVLLGLSSVERQEIISALLPQVRLLTRLLVSERDIASYQRNVKNDSLSSDDRPSLPPEIEAQLSDLEETKPSPATSTPRRSRSDASLARRRKSKTGD